MNRRTRLWVMGSVGGLLVLGYVLGYFATGIWLPRDTTIGQVDVSFARPAEASLLVESRYRDDASDRVVVERADSRFEIDPETLKLTLDADSSVAVAGGQRSWNPITMVRMLISGGNNPLVIDYDSEAMASQIETIANELDTPEIEPMITFAEGKPVVREPAEGLRVDGDALIYTITSSYMRTDQAQDIPMRVTYPKVGQDGLDAALRTFAATALDGPVRLNITDAGAVINLNPQVWEAALSMQVVDGALVPIIDPEVLAEPLAEATKQIGSPATDARIVVKDGKPVIIPGKPGRGINPEDLAEKLVGPLALQASARVLDLTIGDVEPGFSTADAEALGIKEMVSTFTTYYPPTTYRDINQGRAAELINGTILKPGEVYSMNKTVGQRTAANGFVQGGIISGGKFTTGYGGGVSQVATTTYNAAFFAGLDIIQHKAHSVYISRYPMGREATVSWPDVDLKIKNTSPYGVLITAKRVPSAGRSRGELTVSMWSTKYWTIEARQSSQRNWRSPKTIKDSSPDCQPQAPTAGFDVDVTRIWLKDGKQVRTEKVTTKYNAANKIVCVKDD